MTGIRFKTESLEDTQRSALENYQSWVNTYEADVDVAMEQLATYVDTCDGLSEVIISAEQFNGYSESGLQLLRTSTDSVLAPIGLSFESIQVSLESGQKFSMQNFKETLRKIWLAIKRVIAMVWDFIRKGFMKTFSQHRRIAAAILNTRVNLNNLKAALPKTSTFNPAGSELVTNGGRLKNYTQVAKSYNNFSAVRDALLNRYAVKLAVTIKSVLGSKGPLNLGDVNQLEAARVATNKVLINFDRGAVASSFPGARTTHQDVSVVPVIGPYEIVIRGSKLPDVNDANFIRTAKGLSIDINRSQTYTPSNETGEMNVMSMRETEDLLKAAEVLVNDISRGYTQERFRRIEALSEDFNRWVKESEKVAEDWVAKNDNQVRVRQEAIRFFREQALFGRMMAVWGGPVFLKMDTLSLRVAAALVGLCQSNLRVYG